MANLFPSVIGEPPALHDYQEDVLSRCSADFARGARRVLLQAATGSGKTHISSAATRRSWLRGKRVLFLAHRRRLIEQKSTRLDEFGVPHGVLMAGVQTTAGPVQVASRDTLLSRGMRNPWGGLPPADLVIVDEAHNCLGDQYLALLQAYPDAYFLGLTATPARSDGRGLGEFFDALECAVPVSQLVARGFLVPVRCYAPYSARTSSRRQLAGDPVESWRRYADGRPTVLFASKVAASLAARDSFRANDIAAEHVDAKTPDEVRDRVIRDLQAGRVKVVCNVGIWTEGVDVPELSACILLRLAGSYVLYAQAVGRIMRRHPSKADAVLIDHAGAVFEHGFPDEDVEWTLDAADTVDRRNQKAKDEGKRKDPVVCPSCGYVAPGGPVCPSCGHLFKRRPERQPTRAEMLAEVDRGLTPERLAEARRRYWQRCIAVMANKGRTCGAAAQMYRARYKGWPAEHLAGVDLPRGAEWKLPVAERYPHFGARMVS